MAVLLASGLTITMPRVIVEARDGLSRDYRALGKRMKKRMKKPARGSQGGRYRNAIETETLSAALWELAPERGL